MPSTRTLREIRDAYDGLAADVGTGEQVAVTDRVIFLRSIGKPCFATLLEGDGTELQATLSLADLGADGLAAQQDDVDLGDYVCMGLVRWSARDAGATGTSPGMAHSGQGATTPSGRAQRTG